MMAFGEQDEAYLDKHAELVASSAAVVPKPGADGRLVNNLSAEPKLFQQHCVSSSVNDDPAKNEFLHIAVHLEAVDSAIQLHNGRVITDGQVALT